MEFTKEQNRALCEKYPFLDPDRRWGRKNCPDRDEHMPLSPEGAQEWDYRIRSWTVCRTAGASALESNSVRN